MHTAKGTTLYFDGREVAFIKTYNMPHPAAYAFVQLLADLLNANAQPVNQLNRRECSTLLASLRYWQLNITGEAPGDDFEDIANNGGILTPLTADEIDGLCERINHQFVVAEAPAEEETLDMGDIETAVKVFDTNISQQGLLQTLTELPVVVSLDERQAQLERDTDAIINVEQGPTLGELFDQMVEVARRDHKLLLMPDDEECTVTPEQEQRIATYITASFLQLTFGLMKPMPLLDEDAVRLREDVQAMFRIIASQTKL